MDGVQIRGRARRSLLVGAICCALGFALLVAVLLLGHRHPIGPDAPLHRWFVDHRRGAVTAAARALTNSAGLTAYLLVAVAALTAAARAAIRRALWAVLVRVLFAAGTLAAGQLVRVLILHAIARVRPPAADWATSAGSYSFPSGHTTTSALAAGIVVVLALRTTTGASGRTRAVAICVSVVVVAWAVLVALTRIYLGVHWPSDIVGGWLLAAALLLWAAALLPAARATPEPEPEPARAS